jgi:Anti-sigma factor NepR
LTTETDRAGSPADDPHGRAANHSVRNIALQQGLRAAYRTVIEEPLPDRLLALLQQLDGDGPTR